MLTRRDMELLKKTRKKYVHKDDFVNLVIAMCEEIEELRDEIDKYRGYD